VGGRVRTLDEEMRRVREASDRLQQVMELKVRRLYIHCVCSVKTWFSLRFSTCVVSLPCPHSSHLSRRKIGSLRHDIAHGPWPSPRA
jgi:hypothetical protein